MTEYAYSRKESCISVATSMSEMRSVDEVIADEGDIMKSMLPTDFAGTVSLADVVPSCFRALGWGHADALIDVPSSKSVVVILVDGLGSKNISNASAYARFIAQESSRTRPLRTVFPSTTSSALSSFVTGVTPDLHGILGYRVWNPELGAHVNQLSGVTHEEVNAGWLQRPSLLTEAALSTSDRKDVTVVAHPRFASSSLTHMLYSACNYVGEKSIEERFSRVVQLLERGQTGFFLIYISDLDEAAHAHGVISDEWLNKLELLDGSVRRFVSNTSSMCTTVLTADHGVIDVPRTHHLDYGADDELFGVESVGGEPRCLQLKLDGSVPEADVLSSWKLKFEEHARVLTRKEVFAEFYGCDVNLVSPAICERAPEIYVIANDGYVFYDAKQPLSASRGMVGQHGGPTLAEREIPLLIWS